MTSSRRKYMSVVGTIVAGALAGCSGGSGGSKRINDPDANADTQELLPEAPEGWKKTSEKEQLAFADGAQGGTLPPMIPQMTSVAMLRWQITEFGFFVGRIIPMQESIKLKRRKVLSMWYRIISVSGEMVLI